MKKTHQADRKYNNNFWSILLTRIPLIMVLDSTAGFRRHARPNAHVALHFQAFVLFLVFIPANTPAVVCETMLVCVENNYNQ